MASMVVLEVNELPRSVVEWWGRTTPSSPLWELARGGTLTETVLEEPLPRDLYPSQSWASVGTGVPWEKHGVFWYGDPKPLEFPFYWQVAAKAGRTVGMVGVLHSSPVAEQCASDAFRFVLPDPFAVDAGAKPRSLRSLQQVNLRLTRDSGRVASVRPRPSDLSAGLWLVPNGLRPSTAVSLAALAGSVAVGRANRERLRIGQALLLADVFERQLRVHRPDLGVMFTNHVASMMHRYWAATFPGDWPDGLPYDRAWRDRYRGELPFAMKALDTMVARLRRWCVANDRELVIISSMGQEADLGLDVKVTRQAVVRDPQRFLAACGVRPPFEVRAAMVPQLTVVFESAADRETAAAQLDEALGPIAAEIMQTDETLTLSYGLEVVGDDSVVMGASTRSAADVGVRIEPISDHRSGHHSPRGILIASSDWRLGDEIDAFTVAPLLLDRLGVPPLAHHRSPVARRWTTTP